MKAIAIIPARLTSTRLPRKALRDVAGQPLIGRVYNAVCASARLADVIIATDSEEILDVCRQHHWNARLTSAQHRSGSERVQEVTQSVAADIYLNIQGDEPLTRPEHIEALLGLMQDPSIGVGTLKTPCAAAEIANPNAVKVVTDKFGRALYFSRATIPSGAGACCYKHLGFYAYRKPALDCLVTLPPSPLELSEGLEQLRFLENQIFIHVTETSYDTIAVDTEEDLARVIRLLR